MFNLCRNYKIAICLPNYIKEKLNIKQIRVGTTNDFKNYDEWLKNNHPYMFWFENVFCDKLQNIVCYPYEVYSNIRSYLHNRFISKPHILNTKLPVGQWYDYDTRLLHGAFESFVDYVEKEVATMSKWSQDKEDKDKAKSENWGNREWAIYYLDWEITQTHESQAEHAKIKKMLYLWWKDVYNKRPDMYANVEIKGSLLESNYDFSSIHKEEERRIKEDTDMLIELVKIRGGCWT
jgi:hypothetical protein